MYQLEQYACQLADTLIWRQTGQEPQSIPGSGPLCVHKTDILQETANACSEWHYFIGQ